MVIFHSYVSLPEGIYIYSMNILLIKYVLLQMFPEFDSGTTAVARLSYLSQIAMHTSKNQKGHWGWTIGLLIILQKHVIFFSVFGMAPH